MAVKIKSLSVPSLYELKENPEPLILDCDYDVDPTETGFVLKWLHNNGKSLFNILLKNENFQFIEHDQISNFQYDLIYLCSWHISVDSNEKVPHRTGKSPSHNQHTTSLNSHTKTSHKFMYD